MEKIITVSLAGLMLAVIVLGMQTVSELNDGRVERVVASLQK